MNEIGNGGFLAFLVDLSGVLNFSEIFSASRLQY